MLERPNSEPELEPLSDGEMDNLSEVDEPNNERKSKISVTESVHVYISRQIRELGYVEFEYDELGHRFYFGKEVEYVKPRKFFKPKVVREKYELGELDFEPRYNNQSNWLLYVFGRENIESMEEFADVVASKRGVGIEVRLESEEVERWWRGKHG